jgi:hypothetical protein
MHSSTAVAEVQRMILFMFHLTAGNFQCLNPDVVAAVLQDD